MPPKRANRKKIDYSTSASCNEHEDVYQTSSSYSDTAVTLQPEDIKQKLIIASNVTIECKEIKKRLFTGNMQDVTLEPILNRLHNYTNLPISELKTIFDSVVTRDRSFAKALRDVRGIPEHISALLANDIRNIFVKHIVEQKRFPSKMDLLQDLKQFSDKYIKETITIQRLVRNKLIRYQHFPEFNRYLLTEHSDKVYRRTMYLHILSTLRSQDRNFAYVEVRRIAPRGIGTSGFIAGLAAFPSVGKLERFFTKDSIEPIAKKWLQQRILPIVPDDCVIVLAQPKTGNKLTPFSKRLDFIAWLDSHGIPYGKNAHTAELYSLYTTFKRNKKYEGWYDHVFLNAGFTVVHFRSEWQNLNFFRPIWQDVDAMDGYYTGRPESLKQKILNATALLSDLNQAEDSMIEEECKMMKEDEVLEEIIENVFVMAKKGEIQTLDFPKECCGDKTDYFETHVSDIVIDMSNDL